MDLMLLIIGVILGVVGLLGAVIPVLPGTILSYIGFMCVYFVDSSSISTLQLVLCGIVSIAVIVLDYILPGYFSKLFGGTKYGITGATIGTIVGMFFGFVGIIIGPFLGAVVGELSGGSNLGQAIRAGFGSLIGFMFGTLMKLFICFYLLVQSITAITA